MKKEVIKGSQLLDLQLADTQWSIGRWEKWCRENNAGLHIEGGHVNGWDVEAVRYHK
jgi:hypothetical protein